MVEKKTITSQYIREVTDKIIATGKVVPMHPFVTKEQIKDALGDEGFKQNVIMGQMLKSWGSAFIEHVLETCDHSNITVPYDKREECDDCGAHRNMVTQPSGDPYDDFNNSWYWTDWRFT